MFGMPDRTFCYHAKESYVACISTAVESLKSEELSNLTFPIILGLGAFFLALWSLKYPNDHALNKVMIGCKVVLLIAAGIGIYSYVDNLGSCLDKRINQCAYDNFMLPE